MQSISVIHDDPMMLGGAEAVFMHTLQALQDDYDITAITAKPCDLAELNEYYNTKVENVEFTTPTLPFVRWKTAYEWAERLTSGRFGVLDARRMWFFHWVTTRESEADLIIHTQSESLYGSPSIQYIHHPWYRTYPSAAVEMPNDPKIALIERLSNPLTDASDFPSNATLLTNSKWTANDLRSVYGIEATVCPPPVYTEDIPEAPADSKRKDAIIMVGRIVPNKRQHLAFEIVEQVRNQGKNIDLTIVGPTPDETYAEEIRTLAEERSWATVRGPVSRDELIELLTTHRYGLHGHDHEHFGIVVAEMVAGGVLPLVPNNGGQTEIVNNISQLIWETPEEAIEQLSALCEDSDLRDNLRSRLPQINQKYGADRFHGEMKEYVESILSQQQEIEMPRD